MPKPRQRSINLEIQTIRRSLASVVRSLGRLGSALEAAARAPRAGEQPARRKLRLTPERMASLKLQGQYIGHMRMLPPRQQARVKALRLKKGVPPRRDPLRSVALEEQQVEDAAAPSTQPPKELRLSDTYYHPHDLAVRRDRQGAPELWAKFFDWYGAVFADGALTEREKSLIALAVAHAVQCPYCIDAYTQACLEKGSDLDQMTEAVHVAAAIRGGASLVHGVQMRNVARQAGDVAWREPLPVPRSSRAATPLAVARGAARARSTRCRRRRAFDDGARGAGLPPLAADAHRGPPDQRRQAVQPDLPPLPRRRRARPPRGDDPRDGGAGASTRWPRTDIPTVDITGGAPS